MLRPVWADRRRPSFNKKYRQRGGRLRLGRKNKKYYKDLHQQAYDSLTGMQAFGESKKEAVKNGKEGQEIFSFNTYESY